MQRRTNVNAAVAVRSPRTTAGVPDTGTAAFAAARPCVWRCTKHHATLIEQLPSATSPHTDAFIRGPLWRTHPSRVCMHAHGQGVEVWDGCSREEKGGGHTISGGTHAAACGW